MITYVNTVLVSNANGAELATKAVLNGVDDKSTLAAEVGKIAFMNLDEDAASTADIYAIPTSPIVDKFKLGVVTSGTYSAVINGQVKWFPVVKWSNIIQAKDLKSIASIDATNKSSEDSVEIDMTAVKPEMADLFSNGNVSVVLRINYKDLPTGHRQWTESYSYVTKAGDTAKEVAEGLALSINKAVKRQRVVADASVASKLTLTGMPYNDNDDVNSENVDGKVRFNVALYYTNPQAAGYASNNKYEVAGAKIKKTPGVASAVSAKLVRDRELQSLGYDGVFYRNEWYDKRPSLITDLSKTYGSLTIEFENSYHTADNWIKKTKQTVEIYAAGVDGKSIGAGLLAKLQAAAGSAENVIASDNTAANTDTTFARA